ncbi:MAG TPA: acyl-CoA dehydrogenase family protein [Pseudomonadales bacterium]|nr:acyl-CoA dehydrogenase family protein [Pseudomonadales bacterium]
MDLRLREADLAFQSDVRAFIDRHWPEALRDDAMSLEFSGAMTPAQRRWFDALAAQGWSVPSWPVEFGGTGWSPTQHYIWDRETARANCPPMSPFGARMLAPVIYTWGTKAQQERFLPAIRESRITWCQGYSEPGAGSDLASLSTRAVRDGDYYIVNGAKTWTSGAHRADWMFCLVRTDPRPTKKQNGISFLLFDMKTPGVEVHPIITLGDQHAVNSVTLTDVRVPVDQRVGNENEGWTYAKGLLTHERTGIAGVARSQMDLARLRRVATETLRDGERLIDDASFKTKIDSVAIELMALEITELRTLASVEQGGAPGPESSILKIRGTEIQQRLADLTVEAYGYYGVPYPQQMLIDNEGPIGPELAVVALKEMLFGRAASIYGGSNEIQKNIISKAVLGLGG